MSNYVIIGPSGAGKTTSLSALGPCANDLAGTMDRIEKNTNITITPENEKTIDLFEEGAKGLTEGKFVSTSTTDVHKYKFTVAVEYVKRRRILGGEERKMIAGKFELWDGPGGLLFPVRANQGVGHDRSSLDKTKIEEYRKTLQDAMNTSDGVMICISSVHDEDAEDKKAVFKKLPSILARCRQNDANIKRFVVCLTKADLAYYEAGRQAYASVVGESPAKRARDQLTKQCIGAIKGYFPTAELAAAWTSAYGFLDSGAPNFDKHTGKARLDGGNMMNNWSPMGLIEPLEYLVTGRSEGLEIMQV